MQQTELPLLAPATLGLPAVDDARWVTGHTARPPMVGFWLTRNHVIGNGFDIFMRFWMGEGVRDGNGILIKDALPRGWSLRIPANGTEEEIRLAATTPQGCYDTLVDWMGLDTPAPAYPYPLNLARCPHHPPVEWFRTWAKWPAAPQKRPRARIDDVEVTQVLKARPRLRLDPLPAALRRQRIRLDDHA